MGKAIGSSLPLAVGIAISPVPIIAVALILTSRRAQVNGPAFVAGWLAGLGLVGVITLPLIGRSAAGKPGSTSWLSWVEVVLGVLLLLVAAWQFRSWLRGGDVPRMPRWTAMVDKTTPVAALGLAVVLSAANPKNLILAVAGTAAIARTGIPGAQQAIVYVIFALTGTLSVGILVVTYFAMRGRSQKLLLRLKDWMSQHSASITSVLCLVIAAKLFGDAIGALT